MINYAITGSGTAIFNMTDTLTDAKSIISTIAVHKQGSGTLILTSTASTYTGGTTISNGILEAKVPAALPGYGASGKLSVASGATVAVGVGGTGQWSATNINTLLGNTSAFASGSILGFDTTGGNFSYSTVIGSGALFDHRREQTRRRHAHLERREHLHGRHDGQRRHIAIGQR